MARGLAPRLGFAADLEGAVASDVIYLFQARPITTLETPLAAAPSVVASVV
jgi:hypothetical protein